MASITWITWIMKDILPKNYYSSISTEGIMGHCLYFETPPWVIPKHFNKQKKVDLLRFGSNFVYGWCMSR